MSFESIEFEAATIYIELDNEEQEECRGVSDSVFRQQVEDLTLTTFVLLNQTYGEAGTKKYFEMFIELVDTFGTTTVGLESCLISLS